MIKMCIRLHLKYPLILSDFNETDFFDKFSKNTQISNLIKIHPVGGEFFHADWQTDRHNANSRLTQLWGHA